ncbi:hypothetical protein [Parvibacter caecicola]|uniref:hypothetical protein n=1 Tax=Parvibacter caecicola TaxID=747645 RepID=UPI00249A7678|nr:hypothetical protein [Parvibacter caecicola]
MDDAATITPIVTLNCHTMAEFKRHLRRDSALNLTQYRILSLLGLHRNAQTIRQIEQALSLSQPTVWIETRNLQAKGLLAINPLKNKRSSNASLTSLGKSTLANADSSIASAYNGIYGKINPTLSSIHKQGTIIGASHTGLVRIRDDEYFIEHASLELSLKAELFNTKCSQSYGLSLLDLRVLVGARAYKLPMAPSEMADLLLANRPRITESCKGLQLRNLITFNSFSLDKRYRQISLTELGDSLAQKASTKIMQASFAATSRDLNNKEVELTYEIAEACLGLIRQAKILSSRTNKVVFAQRTVPRLNTQEAAASG